MASQGGSSAPLKRKYGDRSYSGNAPEDGSRPSPHRPGSLDTAQHGHAATDGFGRRDGDRRGDMRPMDREKSSYGDGGYPDRDSYGRGDASLQGRGRGGRRGPRGGRGGARGGYYENDAAGRMQARTASTSGPPSASANISPNPPAPSTQPPPKQPPAPPAPPSVDPKQDPVMEKRPQKPQPAEEENEEEEEEEPAILPYQYDHLTDEAIKMWQEGGREGIVEASKQTIEAKDNIALGIIFQEVIRATLDKRINPSDAGSLVHEIVETPDANDGPLGWIDPTTCFLDNVSSIPGGYRTKWEYQTLASLLLATNISHQRMRELLDVEDLEKVGLTRNVFHRTKARFQTSLFYRQQTYNLLREETEGYSKLITELFATSSSAAPNAKEVRESYEHVCAMIGAFDLDVARVLDITLDAFAAMLVRNYRFFIKFLRVSTWWPDHHLDRIRSSTFKFPTLPPWALPDRDGYDAPGEEEKRRVQISREDRDRRFWDEVRQSGLKAFFLLGGHQADPSKISEIEDDTEDGKARKAWAEATDLVPPQGNTIAAQVLGFKLRFYASNARSLNDSLPANLIYLSALLIKIGFISLADLYPHLWPEDSAMSDVKTQKQKEREDRELLQRPGGRQLNALAMAGALTDEPVPGAPVSRLKDGELKRSSSAKPEEKTENPDKSGKDDANATKADEDVIEELPEPSDQKVQLLKSLLCIGALPEALFILGKFPWLPDAFPELPEYIHRILHHCLQKVYESARQVPDDLDIDRPESIPDSDQSGVAKGYVRIVEVPPAKILRWPQPEKYDADQSVEYRFYWDDWADNIPVCQTVDDVFAVCNTLLNFTGVKIGQDSLLLSKLARIGRFSLAEDASDENKKRWMELSKRIIVPALSLTRHNSGVVAEVWELIRHYPITTRYNIYAEWYTGSISRLGDIKSAFELARAETKDVLKRISKTNVKPMARALSKVSTSSPGVVFSVALNQIESYNNLVEVIVECARYFTFLGYDVLTWTLMNSLGARGRNRVQADGMLRSKWLSALALFAGKVFKRYSVMNPSPILQYVAWQLRKGNTTDLIVLEELIGSMAGIVSDATFNEPQTVAMAGGPLLQGQIMLQLLDRRHDSALKTTSRRLMKSLTEPKLAGPLLVSMAQELQTCVYRVPEDEAFLKVLANLYDETHRVLVQYLDLLRTNLSVKDFNATVPSLTALIGDYGLDPALAFWISRPSILAEMMQYDEKVAAEKKETAQASEEKAKATETADVAMAEAGDGSTEAAAATQATAEKEKEQTDAGEAEGEAGNPNETDDAVVKVTKKPLPWHPVLAKLIENTADQLPSEIWDTLSPQFYFTFWQLAVEDIFVPIESYNEENNRLKRRLMAVNSDRSDLSSRGKDKRDEEKKSIMSLQSRLQTEVGSRIATFQKTKQRLTKEKDHWFAESQGKWDEVNVAIIEHCILPRVRLSSLDALYTFKFTKNLHSIGTANFRTVGLLDQFFNTKRLSAVFFICTAQEAENLGKFINELIKDLARWHADKSTYEKEAWGPKKDLPGFKAKTGDKGGPELMGFEDFRRILGKWHTNLHNAFKACFSGGEYMHIRNAINILKSMAANFPVIDWMGRNELGLITELSKSESREDIKLAAMSLLASLKRREKQWVIQQAFSQNTARPNGTAKGASAATPDSGTPSTLNAKAVEFRPRNSPSANGTPKLAVKPSPIETDRMDVEDGEVNSAGINPKSAEAALAVETPSKSKAEDTSAGATPKEDKSAAAEAPSSESSKLASTDKRDKSSLAPSTSNSNEDSSKPENRQPEGRPTNLPPIPPKTAGNGRANHNLPSRPDTGPATRTHDRRGPPGERHHQSEARDGHFTDHRHESRHAEYSRDSGGYSASRLEREHWYNDKNTPHSTGDERYGYDQQLARDQRAPGRDERGDRHARDRAAYDYETRPHEPGRLPRDAAALPSGNQPSRTDRSRPNNVPMQDDRGPPPYLDRRSEVQRADGQSRSASQRGSRTSSPIRRDDRSAREERPSRHERHPRDEIAPPDSRRLPEESYHSRSRYDDGRGPSGAFRNDRSQEPSHPQSERMRESFAPNSGNMHDYESSRGRSGYENDRTPQESRYGRLNDSPTTNTPSRGAPSHSGNSGTSRNAQSNASQMNSPLTSQSGPGYDRGGSGSGPIQNRLQPRSGGAPNRPGASGGSAPSTPSDAPASSVHPDRMKALQESEASGALRNPPAASVSRVQQPPSPVDLRGGPQYQGDRRSDKRFAGLNTILQQPNAPASQPPERVSAPATSIRGRGGRPSGGHGHHQSGNGGGPPSRDGPAPRESWRGPNDGPPASRVDLFANRSASGPVPQSAGDDGGRSGMHDADRHPPPRTREGRSVSPRRGSGFPPPEDRRSMRPRDDAGAPLPPPGGRRGGEEARDTRGRPMAPAPVDREPRRGPPRNDTHAGGAVGGGPPPSTAGGGLRDSSWSTGRPGPPDRRDRGPPPDGAYRGERGGGGMEDGGSGRKRGRPPVEEGGGFHGDGPKRSRR